MADPDVARLEAERLRPTPVPRGATVEDLLRELVHVLATALGHGRQL